MKYFRPPIRFPSYFFLSKLSVLIRQAPCTRNCPAYQPPIQYPIQYHHNHTRYAPCTESCPAFAKLQSQPAHKDTPPPIPPNNGIQHNNDDNGVKNESGSRNVVVSKNKTSVSSPKNEINRRVKKEINSGNTPKKKGSFRRGKASEVKKEVVKVRPLTR